MYQLILLHSCDYLNKISIKTNVATHEGNNNWNEMWDWTKNEIWGAGQGWLWVRVELMASYLIQLEPLNWIHCSWVELPFTSTFYSYFKESFGGEYHMYQVIPLHSCDYSNRLPIKINVGTYEGKSWNETDTKQIDEIGVAAQSWLWVRVELVAW